MANSLITPSIIAKEALFQLHNNLVMAMCVHRDYRREFVKIGNSVSIRKPVKFTSTDGATISKQDVSEGTVSLTIDTRKHVAWEFNTEDLTLTVADYSERYILPANIRLANDVDFSLTGLYSSLWWSAGTPGTTPGTFTDLGQSAQYMDEVAIPDDGARKMILNPATRWNIADALKGVYDSQMPRDFIRKGMLGTLANFHIYQDQNVQMHTTGARVEDAAVAVNGAAQHSNSSPQANTQSLITDGWGADTANSVLAGDVFTIAGVNSVNPISKQSTGRLMEFVVTAAATPSSNAATLTISPAIRTTGAYQNVDAAPADNALLTFKGNNSTNYPQNLAIHKNALALVMVPLALPDGASFKARSQYDGISIRVIKDYSVTDDTDVIRLDIQYGVKAIYPDLGLRLWG